MSRAHLIVVGAGVVGANVAYRLAAEGARVTVVDAAAPGSGTSGASFAWVNAFDKPPRAYHDLNAASLAEYGGLSDEIGGDWLKRVGNLQWEEEPGAMSRLKQSRERLRGWSYAAERITRKEALALEPDLAIAPEVDDVVFTPGESYVEVVPFVAALIAEAGRLGASLLSGHRVTAITRSGGRVRGIETEEGKHLDGDAVINCAGAAAGDIARLAGLEIPVGREPGRLVYTAPVATTLRRVVHAPGVHFRPDGAGRIVLAERAHDVVVAEDITAVGMPAWTAADSLASAARHLPCLRGARVEAVRVGAAPDAKGSAAHRGCRARTGRLLHRGLPQRRHPRSSVGTGSPRAEIVRGETDPRLAPFRPTRFTDRPTPAAPLGQAP